MNADRWRKIQEIFSQVLEHQTHESRQHYLAQACNSDDQLRAEVEKLLFQDEKSENEEFLSPPSKNIKSQFHDNEPEDSLIGRHVGNYDIKRLLGKGGMGNVYLATRTAGYKQLVAIKILKRGLDTDEILRRFRAEIQVLSALSAHQNIAGLIDAGTTDDGLPYFVMDFVEGETLTVYCDKRRLTISERLQIFRAVCAAVQFAHQHGVIHRDLKMSNILMTTDGVPKLIDFGIAKLTAPGLAGQTALPTRTVERFLTPEYASPEQIRGASLTTVSDVYSLGVVLYELLTGHRPFRFDTRTTHTIEKILEESEPENPSTVINRTEELRKTDDSTKEVNLEHVSNLRDTNPDGLKRALRGNLDNITLKALRREPQRRYGAVEQFSADIERHLEGKPVDARPPGWLEAAWRWCRKYPVPVALFVAVIFGLTIGVYHLTTLTEHLVKQSAVESAAHQARVLTEVQDFYTKEVVGDIDKPIVPFDHPYKKEKGKILVPATFTKELGKVITQKSPSGMAAKLYSDRPFVLATNTDESVKPLDAFEREALTNLRNKPDEPVIRYEKYKGRRSLRYAVARVLKHGCLKCHNNTDGQFPDAPRPTDDPKSEWKVGDVRGVLEIIRPLDKDYERIQSGLRTTFAWMVGLSAGLLLLSLILLAVAKKRQF